MAEDIKESQKSLSNSINDKKIVCPKCGSNNIGRIRNIQDTVKRLKHKCLDCKKNFDADFEKLVEKDFARIPRAVFWYYTWITRHLVRYEAAVFQAILAATWGWNKMEGWVAINLIARMTSIL